MFSTYFFPYISELGNKNQSKAIISAIQCRLHMGTKKKSRSCVQFALSDFKTFLPAYNSKNQWNGRRKIKGHQERDFNWDHGL